MRPIAIAMLAPLCAAQQLSWTQARGLAPRVQTAVAFDAARDRLVLFGGFEGVQHRAETWEWDGAHWLQRLPQRRPQGRSGHALVYDRARQRVVLFSGRSGSSTLSDQWLWDGSDWYRVVGALLPPGRDLAAVAYDDTRDLVVLYGGYASSVRLDDTWTWDGVGWTLRSPAATPGARGDAAMAHDSARGRTVLYGGSIVGNLLPRDTWEWDGTNWIGIPTTTAPNAELSRGIAFDASRGRVVLFGGARISPRVAYDETWEWDGASWQQRATASRPPPQLDSLLAFDPGRGHAVHVGSTAPCATWSYDGADWTLRADGRAPHLIGPIMRPDGNGAVVMFGTARNPLAQLETWRFADRRWSRLLAPGGPQPANLQAATDPVRGRVVAFGGAAYLGPSVLTDATWEWDGTAWLGRSPATAPPARHEAGMAFDAVGGGVLLFGGNTSLGGVALTGDTWRYDGTAWRQLAPVQSPAPRRQHAMAADLARQRVVLHGGRNALGAPFGDTWEWDGTGWVAFAGSSPAARASAAMDYDPLRQRVVMLGGAVGAFPVLTAEAWAFDGVAWTQLTTGAGPEPRAAGQLAFDPQTGEFVLHGGLVCDVHCNHAADTWLLGEAAAAAAAPLGAGCGAAGGIPVVGGDEPWLGNQGFRFEVRNAPASGLCALAISGSQQTQPVGGGCALYIGPPLLSLLTVANAHGVATLPVPIPNDPVFQGMVLYEQAAVFGPTSPLGGVALSAARALHFGR